jgi:hypothetical protein
MEHLQTDEVVAQSKPKESSDGFTPAALALMGTTDARNLWRPPLVKILRRLGVDTSTIFDPRIEGRDWIPEVEVPLERFQKFNADNVLLYIGDNGEGDPSTYSAFEVGDLMRAREPDSLAVVLDDRGLSAHGKKQLEAIGSDIRATTPGIRIAESVGKGLDWIVDRLGLKASLGEYALELVGSSIDNEHLSATSPKPLIDDEYGVRTVTNRGEDVIARLAQSDIREIQASMDQLPCEESYPLTRLLDIHCNPDLTRKVNDYVADYFRSRGWSAGKNRQGVFVVRRPSKN